jgi:hypothetical protein
MVQIIVPPIGMFTSKAIFVVPDAVPFKLIEPEMFRDRGMLVVGIGGGIGTLGITDSQSRRVLGSLPSI